MKFELGNVVATATATEALRVWGKSLPWLLSRHQSGDWGDQSEEMQQFNQRALTEQLNLVSVYRTPAGKLINVFTRADRTLTLVHLGL